MKVTGSDTVVEYNNIMRFRCLGILFWHHDEANGVLYSPQSIQSSSIVTRRLDIRAGRKDGEDDKARKNAGDEFVVI